MSDTPIIDAAIIKAELAWHRHGNGQRPHYERMLDAVTAALRAALPWTPPAEAIEAMARAICANTPAYPAYKEWRASALAAYRAQPIMRELYDESGAPR